METSVLKQARSSDIVGPESVMAFKGGLLRVEEIRQTPEVPAGGIVDTHVDVANNADFIREADPDRCVKSESNGYEYLLTVTPLWDEPHHNEYCLTINERKNTHRLDFMAPSDPGTYKIQYDFFLPGSRENDVVLKEINVTENGGDPRPGPPPSGSGSLSTLSIVLIIFGISITLIGLIILF